MQIRQLAAYNLPCMHLRYRDVQAANNISFQDIYLKFSEEEDSQIRLCIGSSLHEAFAIIKDDEDTTALRKCFLSYILDGAKDTLSIMNKNLAKIIFKYGNKHTMENFKGRTPYVDPNGSEGGDQSKDSTPKSKTATTNKGSDFTSALIDSTNAKKLTKKNTHLGINFDRMDEEDTGPKLPPIYVTSEHEDELVYSDLLQRLMVFINNCKAYNGLWREHAQLINQMVEVIHLFYMPEIH